MFCKGELTIEPLTLSIGVGLVVGVIFVEFFGLSVGGMIVPGYIALDIVHPVPVILTLSVGLLVYAIIRLLSVKFIIYGRRRIVLTVLIAFLLGALTRSLFSSVFAVKTLGEVYSVIGYIIPGLIAISIDRQGIIETFTTLITASAIVRLVLIIFIGPALII